MLSNEAMFARLDALYAILKSLRPTSPQTDFEKFGAFFSPDAKVYFSTMRNADKPGRGQQGAIDDIREIVNSVTLLEREVTSQVVDTAGCKVFFEMDNKLGVCGKILELHAETGVATFDVNGLISEFRLYSCWGWISRVIQQQTGEGPYKQEVIASEPIPCCK